MELLLIMFFMEQSSKERNNIQGNNVSKNTKG